jgi:hypothetical protein
MSEKTEPVAANSRTEKRGRVILFLFGTLIAAVYGYWRVEATTYQPIEIKAQSVEVQRRTVDSLLSQSNTLGTWALLLAASMSAVAVTTKVHRVARYERLFALLGPAMLLALMALRAGWYLQRRVTNMVALDNYNDFKSVAELLISQGHLLLLALVLASVFALWYLLNIVAGNVIPHDNSIPKEGAIQ